MIPSLVVASPRIDVRVFPTGAPTSSPTIPVLIIDLHPCLGPHFLHHFSAVPRPWPHSPTMSESLTLSTSQIFGFFFASICPTELALYCEGRGSRGQLGLNDNQSGLPHQTGHINLRARGAVEGVVGVWCVGALPSREMHQRHTNLKGKGTK